MKITLHPFMVAWLGVLWLFLVGLVLVGIVFGLFILSFRLGEAYAIGYARARVKKLEKALDSIMGKCKDACEELGTEVCSEGQCDCDPNGFKGCLTQIFYHISEFALKGEDKE